MSSPTVTPQAATLPCHDDLILVRVRGTIHPGTGEVRLDAPTVETVIGWQASHSHQGTWGVVAYGGITSGVTRYPQKPRVTSAGVLSTIQQRLADRDDLDTAVSAVTEETRAVLERARDEYRQAA